MMTSYLTKRVAAGRRSGASLASGISDHHPANSRYYAQLRKDVLEVRLHRLPRGEQPLRDVAVGDPLGGQRYHAQLGGGQAMVILDVEHHQPRPAIRAARVSA